MANMHDKCDELESIKSSLVKCEGLTDKNREDIIKFFNHLEAKGRSSRTVKKVWDRLKLLVKFIPNKDFKDFTQEDFEMVLASLRKRYSDWSIVTAQKVYRSYWRWLYGLDKRDRPPKVVDWFEIETPPTRLTKQDLLTKKEKDSIISATNNIMQKALISVLCAGPRPGEILGMTLGDVTDEKEFIKIYAKDGKMRKKIGQRPVYVIDYADFLRAWLSSHPMKSKKEAPLFVTKNGPLHSRNLNLIVKRLAKKAGIKKRVWPYIFRHGYGTMVYSKYGASHGKRLMGHKTLKQESVYVHLDESDLEARLLGKDNVQDGKTVKKEEVEMEVKRETFTKALLRREDIIQELREEMQKVIQEEIRLALQK